MKSHPDVLGIPFVRNKFNYGSFFPRTAPRVGASLNKYSSQVSTLSSLSRKYLHYSTYPYIHVTPRNQEHSTTTGFLSLYRVNISRSTNLARQHVFIFPILKLYFKGWWHWMKRKKADSLKPRFSLTLTEIKHRQDWSTSRWVIP